MHIGCILVLCVLPDWCFVNMNMLFVHGLCWPRGYGSNIMVHLNIQSSIQVQVDVCISICKDFASSSL